MDRLLLRNVRPLGGTAVDLLVGGGRIVAVGEGLAAPEGVTVVDGPGQPALPGLVDAAVSHRRAGWDLG